MKCIFVLCLMAVVILQSTNGYSQSPINEVYKKCDRICNFGKKNCLTNGVNPGCCCIKDYLRWFFGRECVPESCCPRAKNAGANGVQISGPGCPENEVYQYCGVGSQCENYCGRGPNVCAYCKDGCYCKKGYIRSNSNHKSTCIPENQCPQAQADSSAVAQSTGRPQCRNNEVYKPCNGCDQVCNREPIFCTQDCSSPGCYCERGYVRLFPGGCCVQPGNCPRCQSSSGVQNAGPKIGCCINEVYKEYGGCDQICNQGPIVCTQGSRSCGCFCQDGYVRSFSGGICIPKIICPYFPSNSLALSHSTSPKIGCGTNEVYKECGGCDQICNRDPIFCTQDCRSRGCFCKNGYVRSFLGGICIPRSLCLSAQADSSTLPQNTSPGCPANEEYRICGEGSQCEYYCGRGPYNCADCEDGCYCKKGFIRKNSAYKSDCITENECCTAENEEYHRCGVGSNCENYCGKSNTTSCSYCEDGCYCKENYIRANSDYKSKCIPKNNC